MKVEIAEVIQALSARAYSRDEIREILVRAVEGEAERAAMRARMRVMDQAERTLQDATQR